MRPETRAYLKAHRSPDHQPGEFLDSLPDLPGTLAEVIDRASWEAAIRFEPDHPVNILRAAADLLETTAATAPTGPYTMDTLRTPDDTRLLFAGDGDAFAVATDWAGGHGIDTGTPEQTAAHLTVWTPQVARCVAAWLRSCADLHEHTPYEVRRVLGEGCQWCNDEDWPCADMRHALNTARALLESKDHT